MTEPDDDTCRPVEVDGELIRVRGGHEMTDEGRAMFAEVVRAAKRRYAAEHPVRHTVDTITSDALDALYESLEAAQESELYRQLRSADNAFASASVRAAKAEAAIARLTRALPAVRRALDSLPARCRYHGEDTDPRRPSYGAEACCDTGVAAQRRKLAEQALTALANLETP